ncbi:MAG: adenylyltransferase/cytidyltransferase family protein [Nanoarchaeota archaeon]|nr:adenylyltransferase/cytidyltransferase family protein [Nanoarchaeota archaeon]MBU0978139.1 adenylyltransferase/cytidyltransferase family protein [Nanoarchaeota archaeon]
MKPLNFQTKIKSREEIIQIAEKARQDGKTIVTLNGSFDLLHAGHLDILEEAAKQGDIFILGLNSDKSVSSYKGQKRPIIAEEHRARFLANLNYIDYVTLFDEKEPLAFIDSIKPNVHVNGADYGENCIEAPIVKKYGGRIHIVNFKTPISTSKIIDRIRGL